MIYLQKINKQTGLNAQQIQLLRHLFTVAIAFRQGSLVSCSKKRNSQDGMGPWDNACNKDLHSHWNRLLRSPGVDCLGSRVQPDFLIAVHQLPWTKNGSEDSKGAAHGVKRQVDGKVLLVRFFATPR